MTKVTFFEARTDRTWARDNLPTFVTHPDTGALGAVKWRFNGWARYDDHELDEAAGMAVAKAAVKRHALFVPKYQIGKKAHRFVLEGGSIDVDGEGTVLTTRRCLLGEPFARNPGLSQPEVEEVLRQNLGVTSVLWVEDGIAGDDTSGHIDDFARFVAPGKVVVCQSARDDQEALFLRQAYEELSVARDARGRKLELFTLPMPEPVFYRGEQLPASYANFYIANNSVLVPVFNDQADRTALGILAELFPIGKSSASTPAISSLAWGRYTAALNNSLGDWCRWAIPARSCGRACSRALARSARRGRNLAWSRPTSSSHPRRQVTLGGSDVGW